MTRASARLAGKSAVNMPPPPPVKKSKKPPAPKTPAAPKKRENYGYAKFLDKTDQKAYRAKEKNAAEKREKNRVESPFKDEVHDRIQILKSLKKMIQKIVTGAQKRDVDMVKRNVVKKIWSRAPTWFRYQPFKNYVTT